MKSNSKYNPITVISSTSKCLSSGNQIIEIKEAVKFNLQNEPLTFNLGLLLTDEINTKSDSSPTEIITAIKVFGNAISMNLSRDDSWYNVAQLKQKLNDIDGAVSAYKQTIEITFNSEVASASYTNLIELLLSKNRIEEAAMYCNNYVNQHPNNEYAWLCMGVLLRETNDNMNWSSLCFQNALKLSNNTNTVALTNLGKYCTTKRKH